MEAKLMKPLIAWRAFGAIAAGFALGGSAAAGTVSGTITAAGIAASAAFTVTVFKDDGGELTHIDMPHSGLYSLELEPGRYKVVCNAPGRAAGSPQYLIALDAPISRNLTLSC
jgi:uncharacterized cupredoxin-like copper-binding protein